MAQTLEGLDPRAAFAWRSRVVELNPKSNEDRFALTKAAMRVGDYGAATNALDRIDAAGKNTTEYHTIAGGLAMAAGQPAQAESHFLEACRLSPGEPSPQLNLARIRLLSTNAQSLAEARASLKQISANPTNSNLRCQALRGLVVDGLRQKQYKDALAISKKLLQETNATFYDRTLHLDVLQQSRSPELRTTLAAFQREAADSPAAIGIMAQWQMTNSTPAEVLQWLQSLPEKSRTNAPANITIAECLTSMKQWPQLHAFLANQNWSDTGFGFHAPCLPRPCPARAGHGRPRQSRVGTCAQCRQQSENGPGHALSWHRRKVEMGQ